ncbi:hypothetical protein, partial [Streptomyces mirabilis]|uniref:hypothetical protein n=1 Tax=Streptomyces mirabilis TaxID=68239 RepID=UPI0036DBA7CF
DRTGTKRSPAGKRSEGSGSSEYSTGDMMLLLEEGDVRRSVGSAGRFMKLCPPHRVQGRSLTDA